MISGSYRGSRFDASDIPLLSKSWNALDAIALDGADVQLEVLAGTSYRRRLSSGLGKTAYLLQAVISPSLSRTTFREWESEANAIIGQIGTSLEGIAEEQSTSLARVVLPRYEGPFGTGASEDMITEVYQPVLLSRARRDDGSDVEVRVGIAAPVEYGAFHDVYPAQCWTDLSVKSARHGAVVIPAPSELHY